MFFNHKKQVKKQILGVKKPTAASCVSFHLLFVALSHEGFWSVCI